MPFIASIIWKDKNRSNLGDQLTFRLFLDDILSKIDLYRAKETINKTKRQPSQWEKTFANGATNKELISKKELLSKISKQLMQLNIKKTTQSKNGGERSK